MKQMGPFQKLPGVTPYPVKYRPVITYPLNETDYGFALTGPVFDEAGAAQQYSVEASVALGVPAHRAGMVAALDTDGPHGEFKWRQVCAHAEMTGIQSAGTNLMVCGQTVAEAQKEFNDSAPPRPIGNPVYRKEVFIAKGN